MQDSFYSLEDTKKYQNYKKFEKTYKLHGVKVVRTHDELVALVKLLYTVGTFAVDTETTGLDVLTCKIVGIGFCWGLGLGESAYIPLGHTANADIDNQLAYDVCMSALRPLLEGIETKKVLHNAKFDINVLRNADIKLGGLCFDTIVAHYLLNPNHYSEFYDKQSNHKLDIVIFDYYPIFPYTFDSLVKKGTTIADLPINDVAYYCAIDCWCTWALYLKLEQRIANSTLLLKNLYYNVELPLINILADMEQRGLSINDDWYVKMKLEIKPVLTNIKEQASSYKEGINLSSPKQLNQYLFNELQLPSTGLKKTKLGYSIDAESVKLLTGLHPFIDLLSRYKEIVHLYNTFIEGMYKKKHTLTGKLHPNFNQVVTDTGRLSCSNPNAQNFPKRFREGIVPVEGNKFISFDYSQCELRILAYLSQETVLLQAFKNGEDIHMAVARILLGKYDVTPDERRGAKTLNFGIVYGMQEFKLATMLSCSIKEAKKLIKDYWDKLPMVKIWFEKIYRQAIGNGYTETIMGRRRYYDFDMPLLRKCRGTDYKLLPELKSILGKYKLWEHDSESLRSAGNAPIQGSNADITKLAMVQCQQFLNSNSNLDCSMVLNIHDELIFECKASIVDTVIPLIKSIMENVYDLGIPLIVDYHVGDSWKECK